jgi:hypothetical protein
MVAGCIVTTPMIVAATFGLGFVLGNLVPFEGWLMVRIVDIFDVEKGLRTVAPHGCHCSSRPRCLPPLGALSGSRWWRNDPLWLH